MISQMIMIVPKILYSQELMIQKPYMFLSPYDSKTLQLENHMFYCPYIPRALSLLLKISKEATVCSSQHVSRTQRPSVLCLFLKMF